MGEVASDDELLGSDPLDEMVDPLEVPCIVPIGDGEPVGAKGGRLAKVRVGEDEDGMPGKMDGMIGKKLDLEALMVNEHGNYPAALSREASMRSRRVVASAP